MPTIQKDLRKPYGRWRKELLLSIKDFAKRCNKAERHTGMEHQVAGRCKSCDKTAIKNCLEITIIRLLYTSAGVKITHR